MSNIRVQLANTNRRRRERSRRPARRNPNVAPGMSTATMPMSYAAHVQPYFRSTGNREALRLNGCDLVKPISLTGAGGNTIFSVIPANPAYWEGTKIASIAAAYFNYRPLKLAFHYIPQVPVTVSGTVVAGTLWNGQAGVESL